MALPALVSFWAGERLDYLQQLCVVSGLAAGHPFYVYSYEPDQLVGVPAGVEVRDAAEVMPRGRLITHTSGSITLGADFWRYEMLARGLGCWVDLDLLILKSFGFEQPYIVGKEQSGIVNNAVLLAPADSPFVKDLVKLAQHPGCPPWFGPRSKLRYYMQAIRSGYPTAAELPWGTFGPRLLSYAVRKHGLSGYVSPADVFYPITWQQARSVYDPAADVDRLLTQNTRAIHLYNSQLGDLTKAAAPPGSFIHKQCQRLGII